MPSLPDAKAAITLIQLSNDSFAVHPFDHSAIQHHVGKMGTSVLDLELTTALVYIEFSSIPQRLHQSTIRTKSLLRDNTAGTLLPSSGTLANKVSYMHNPQEYSL